MSKAVCFESLLILLGFPTREPASVVSDNEQNDPLYSASSQEHALAAPSLTQKQKKPRERISKNEVEGTGKVEIREKFPSVGEAYTVTFSPTQGFKVRTLNSVGFSGDGKFLHPQDPTAGPFMVRTGPISLSQEVTCRAGGWRGRRRLDTLAVCQHQTVC